MRGFQVKRIVALLLLLVLLGGAACARGELAGVDAALSGWLGQEGALSFSASMQAETLLPYGKDTLALLNRLLAHVSFQVSVEEDGEGGMTLLSLGADGQEVFSLTEREQEGSYTLETSLLPNRVLESRQTSPIALLSGEEEIGTPGPSFDMLTAFSQAEGSYKDLIGACEPYSEKKRANYKIKEIGSAKWSQIARLTTEQSDAMLPLLRAVLKSGMDEGYQAELDQVRFGKGFIVALYKASETGKDMAVYMKGNLLYPDGSTRRLAYQWAFVNNGTERKDSYKYETLKDQRPADNRVIQGLVTRKLFTDQISLKGSSEASFKQDSMTHTATQRLNLTGKTVEGARTLEGSWTEQTQESDGDDPVTHSLTLTPSLIITPGDGGATLSGTIQVEQKKDKIVETALAFTLSPELPESFATTAGSMYAVTEPQGATLPPVSSITQNADEAPVVDASAEPQGPAASNDYLVGRTPIGLQAYAVPSQSTSVFLDGVSQENLTSLLGELSQNLAGKLLRAFAQLPEEDTAFLRDGMTDEDAVSFFSLLGDL